MYGILLEGGGRRLGSDMCLFAKLVEEPFSENCLARRKLDVAAQSCCRNRR
jgi:hypothetical protein